MVADDTLVPVPVAGVMAGLGEDTVLLIDSTEPPAMWNERLKVSGPVVILPATRVGERADAPYVGAECAGAAARLTGVISRTNLEAAVRAELAPMAKDVVERNVRAALAAFDRMEAHAGLVKEGVPATASEYSAPDWIDMPADDVSLSGPAIHGGVTSVQVRTGLWRTMRPVIDYARCRKCTWVCGSFCPDSAISVADDGRPVIDLDHCKGCMICVAQCPPHAIEAIPEEDAAAAETERRMEGSTA